MSRIATDWAWGLNLAAPQKLLMLSLADRADEYHCCYPSIRRLVNDTGLDRKTISKWINILIESGVIEDTGERKGRTKMVRVLRLNVGFECTQKRDGLKTGNDPKIGPLNDPKIGHLNDPKFGTQNQSLEPNIEPKDITPIVPKGDVCVEHNPIDDKPEKNTQAILTVFRHWQAEHNHSTAKLDQKRRKRINARLEEGFSPDELCKAISGAKYDAWLMGKNPSNRKYDGIETLLRDAAQVEKLRDLTNNDHAKAVATGEYSAVTASNLENIQRWLEREDEGAPI